MWEGEGPLDGEGESAHLKSHRGEDIDQETGGRGRLIKRQGERTEQWDFRN